MLANTAAMRAHSRVNTTHKPHTSQSGVPPIIKWDTAPVRAVKVMMNTLVPTAVFSSYPSTLVRMSSIIMPPPAPIKPQMKPMSTPHTTDCTARFCALTPCMASLVVITGRRMNLMPSKKVMNTEKPPMVAEGILLATQLPTTVKASTLAIMIRPFLISRFLFLW